MIHFFNQANEYEHRMKSIYIGVFCAAFLMSSCTKECARCQVKEYRLEADGDDVDTTLVETRYEDPFCGNGDEASDYVNDNDAITTRFQDGSGVDTAYTQQECWITNYRESED